MRGRYEFENAFVTDFAINHTISIGVDDVLPLADVPSIADGKYFWVSLEPLTPLKSYVLRCYMSGGAIHYHGYDVTQNINYLQHDDAQISDVAEYLNYLANNVDDFGYTVATGLASINIYGGEVIINGTNVVVPDLQVSTFTEGLNYVILNYDTQVLEVVDDLTGLNYMRLASVMINLGNVVSITDDRRLQTPVNYDTAFFDFTNNFLTIKSGSIGVDELDLVGINTDDINEGAVNLYFTEARVNASSDVALNTAASHTHPNKALLDTYLQTEIDLASAVAQAHTHSNFALLETYDQLNSDIVNAVGEKHTHPNKNTIDAIPNYLTAGLGTVLTRTGAGLEFSVGTGGGGAGVVSPSSTPVREVFTGDGVTDTYALLADPASPYSVFIFNDSGQFYSAGIDYTLSGLDITWISTPDSGRKITIVYFVGGSGGYAAAQQEVFVGDGLVTTRVLSDIPVTVDSLFLFNDSGQFYANGVDYTILANTITFLETPESGRDIRAIYFLPDGSAMGEINTMINLPGPGVGIYAQKVGFEFQLRKLRGINGCTVSQVGDEIIIDGNIVPMGAGEANTASNIGTGIGLFKVKSGVDLQFKTFLTDDIITMTSTDDSIVFELDEDALNPRLYRHFMFGGNG